MRTFKYLWKQKLFLDPHGNHDGGCLKTNMFTSYWFTSVVETNKSVCWVQHTTLRPRSNHQPQRGTGHSFPGWLQGRYQLSSFQSLTVKWPQFLISEKKMSQYLSSECIRCSINIRTKLKCCWRRIKQDSHDSLVDKVLAVQVQGTQVWSTQPTFKKPGIICGKWRQPDPWGSLTSQPNLFEVSGLGWLWSWEKNKSWTVPEERPSRLFSYLCRCTLHLQTCIYTQTPAQTQERKSNGEEAVYEKKEKDCLV